MALGRKEARLVDWIRACRTYSELSATASHPPAGLRQGGKTVEKRHRVIPRAGAVVEAAYSIGANPYYSAQRFYRVLGIKTMNSGISLLPKQRAYGPRRLQL